MSSRRESDFLTKLFLGAQQARQEADQRVEEEHRARQEADRALQNDLQLNQNTSLEEFLQACHEYYHEPLRIETNKSWTTQGTTQILPENNDSVGRVSSKLKQGVSKSL